MKITVICIATVLIMLLTGCATNNNQTPIKEKIVTGAAYLKPQKFRYPEGAMRAEQEGTVRLKILVLASGKVAQIEILKSSGFEVLDVSATADMQLIEFTPAKTKSGVAVDSWMIAPIIYKLE